MKATKKQNEEPRYVGTNWDPDVSIVMHTCRNTIERKVKTKGTKVIKADFILDRVEQYLRQGYDVYLDDAVRFYPCVAKDLKSMIVSAQTVGVFRHALGDKKFTLRYCGEEIDADDANERVRQHYEKTKQTKVEITPDTMVTCPECGYEFRVGRKISL